MDRYRDLLVREGGRLTREREHLLEVVCNYEGHFRPEDLVREMGRRGGKVALTTVYRNIPLLLEAGIIRRASIHEEAMGSGWSYEHVLGHEHHDHLVCTACHRRVEFRYPAIEVLQEAVAKEHGFELEYHHLELAGLCPECRGHRDSGS